MKDKVGRLNQKRKTISGNVDFHTSVLYKEVLDELRVKKCAHYIDATVGGGGHTKGILKSGGRVLGLDADPNAVKFVAKRELLPTGQVDGRLCAESDNLTLVNCNFSQISKIAPEFGFERVDGILFDLGVSSYQLEDENRGFSFSKGGPLDMRMDQGLRVTAADLVNGLNQGELYELFNKYGEERRSRHIARAIVETRVKKKIKTTKDLVEIIEQVFGRNGKIHPATRVFQALRIAVNDELNNLKKGLSGAVGLLAKNGRIIAISFHSLEDRIVKDFFRERVDLQNLTKSPIVPAREEIISNPRSRSAKMRVAERV